MSRASDLRSDLIAASAESIDMAIQKMMSPAVALPGFEYLEESLFQIIEEATKECSHEDVKHTLARAMALLLMREEGTRLRQGGLLLAKR